MLQATKQHDRAVAEAAGEAPPMDPFEAMEARLRQQAAAEVRQKQQQQEREQEGAAGAEEPP